MKQHSRVRHDNYKNTLHHALGPFLLLSQFFGVLPVLGICPTSRVSHVRFRWVSLSLLVTLALITFSVIDIFLASKVIFERGLKLYTAGPFTFSIICFLAFSAFLLVARNWPNLIQQTRQVEHVFLQPSYASPASKYFSRRIRIYGVFLIVAAIVEHLSYVGSAIYSNGLQIKHCNLTVNFWENYFMRERLQIFSIINFRLWLIPLTEWISIAMTYVWNFVDIFLTLVSMGLAMRFNQLHWRLEQHKMQHLPGEFWASMRKDFMILTDLLAQLDDKLSILILLSCTHNMYFICVQVFHSFIPKANFSIELYFWISLIIVLTRFFTMLFVAASVNDAANKILTTLYEVPTAYWCLELERFNEIVASDLIALSGKRFFFVTKRMIFAMAGTIVIYELVLIDQVHDAVDHSNYCVSRKF